MRSAARFFYASAPYYLSLWGRTPRDLACRPPEAWPGDPARGAALLDGEFRFGGEPVQSASPPWDAPRSPEWRAWLHGFAWLGDLAALQSDASRRMARNWTADWLVSCDLYDPFSWRADILGDRLFHWIEHFEALAGGAEEENFRRALLGSAARQMRHLARTAGKCIGLARLKALRGLIAAAATLDDRRRLTHSLTRLVADAETQILPDGGHAARGPSAQQEALRHLIDARAALIAAQQEVPAPLQQAIDRATPMLRFYRHGDGRFALFNGTGESDAAAIDLVLDRADAKGRVPFSAPHVGFQRLQAARTIVLMDCGAVPPRGFDGAAHAGALSFEMSYGRERLIVNCGAYHGPSAEWRTAARATAAHSTLVVADTNSAEIRPDGSFGRGPSNVTMDRAEENGSLWVAASHDGYLASFGLTHARHLFLSADGEDLRGEDRLTGRPGNAFAIRFHLHPAVQASVTQDGSTVLLRLSSGIGWRLKAQGGVLSIGESIYLGTGERRKTQQIVIDGHVGTNGAAVRWAIRREGRKPVEAANQGREAEIEL